MRGLQSEILRGHPGIFTKTVERSFARHAGNMPCEASPRRKTVNGYFHSQKKTKNAKCTQRNALVGLHTTTGQLFCEQARCVVFGRRVLLSEIRRRSFGEPQRDGHSIRHKKRLSLRCRIGGVQKARRARFRLLCGLSSLAENKVPHMLLCCLSSINQYQMSGAKEAPKNILGNLSAFGWWCFCYFLIRIHAHSSCGIYRS